MFHAMIMAEKRDLREGRADKQRSYLFDALANCADPDKRVIIFRYARSSFWTVNLAPASNDRIAQTGHKNDDHLAAQHSKLQTFFRNQQCLRPILCKSYKRPRLSRYVGSSGESFVLAQNFIGAMDASGCFLFIATHCHIKLTLILAQPYSGVFTPVFRTQGAIFVAFWR